MDAKVFKNLIKEAVREAVREELGLLLLEQKKQSIQESLNNDTTNINYSSRDVMPGNPNIRASLRSKMGEAFGFQQQQPAKLAIIDAVDENTGEKVNPFAAFLADSAANMTAQDLSGLRNLG
jgi:hypothetical protein